jgi:hypothetical protein
VSRGSTYKRCGCTESVNEKRRQLGQQCPKLRRRDGSWNPKHGTWSFSITVRGRGGKPVAVRKAGYGNQEDAERASTRSERRPAAG